MLMYKVCKQRLNHGNQPLHKREVGLPALKHRDCLILRVYSLFQSPPCRGFNVAEEVRVYIFSQGALFLAFPQSFQNLVCQSVISPLAPSLPLVLREWGEVGVHVGSRELVRMGCFGLMSSNLSAIAFSESSNTKRKTWLPKGSRLAG